MVYGAGQDAVAVTVDPKVITKILHSDSGHNTIFDLNVEGGAPAKAMIVDWQNEPIKGKLLHIDLKRIAMDKTMRVSVPIQLIGIPVGVKTQGGILEHVLREVEIECLPGDIPSHLDVDVSNLEMHGVDSRLGPAALGQASSSSATRTRLLRTSRSSRKRLLLRRLWSLLRQSLKLPRRARRTPLQLLLLLLPMPRTRRRSS